jgi:hypothetical protein
MECSISYPKFSEEHTASILRRQDVLAGHLLGLLFDLEDEFIIFLRNVGDLQVSRCVTSQQTVLFIVTARQNFKSSLHEQNLMGVVINIDTLFKIKISIKLRLNVP